MGIDRLTTLAFSLYSNKGAYALLLGSGISRAAHIPSAWEVENVLISKMAAIKGVTDEADWHEWYKNEFGKVADYSSLLDSLTSKKTERVGLMRGFFEPTEEDREMEWKMPTVAHKAIAKLAKEGFVKVVLTTNFDRLLEDALAAENVTYQVVLHESDLEKITPIIHSNVPTIVKINGDYIDCRFRNTASELSSYPVELKGFLTRIFEDFGLITCGWSATWDKGLVEIIKQAKNSRYNSFLSYVGDKNDDIENLAISREGEALKIDSADTLFNEIYEQVSALERNAVSKNLNKDIVLSRVKKYLESDQHSIDFAELIEKLGEEAYNNIQAIANYSHPLSKDTFRFFFNRHKEVVSTLLDVAAVVGRWGTPSQVVQIGDVIVKLCLRPLNNGSITAQNANYQHGIAATLLYNALGVSCVHYSNYQGLSAFVNLEVPAENFVTTLYRSSLLKVVGVDHLGRGTLNELIGNSYYYPFSRIILDELRSVFGTIFKLNDDYETAFFKWEHLKSLLFGYEKCYFMNIFSVPTGDFIRYEEEQRLRSRDATPYINFFDSAEKLKDEWLPIKQGLFGGMYDNYKDVYGKAEEFYKNNRIAW